MTAIEAPTVDHLGQWITSHGLLWHLEEIHVDSVDTVSSRDNQVRIEPLDAGAVERYAEDMRRGDRFPPIVVTPGRAGWRILGGNHRHAAAQLARLDTITAIIVEGPAETLQLIAFEDNRRHGLPPTDEDRIVQAQLLMSQGWTREAACATVGITVGKVERANGAAEAERRAVRLGVPAGFFNLPLSSRWRLGSLRSDPVFAAAAGCVLVTAMTSQAVYTWVTELNAARSEEQALALIAEKETELLSRKAADAGKSRNGRAVLPHAKLASALGVLRELDDVAAVQGATDKAELLRKAKAGRAVLTRVIKALEQ